MLSSLPKLADRNFILGFLVPMLVFTIAGLALYHDVEPFKRAWDATVQAESLTKLTLLAVGVTVGAILLLVGNHALYQVLEGYWGPFNRPAWRKEMQRRFGRDRKHLETLLARAERAGEHASPEATREYFKNLWEFYLRFPYREDLVLPTRFGNVIRAFETYPSKVYGAEGISAWLRLAGVVPKSMQTQADNARAEVDLFVNLWFLSLAFGILAVVRGAVWAYEAWPVARLETPAWLSAAGVVVALAAAKGFYEAGITRARSWGGVVKSMFDLYLPALAKQLGYRLPNTQADRERFRNDVTHMFLYLEPLKAEAWASLSLAEESDVAGQETASKDKDENGDKEEDDE
jgi:hypothetical protein